MPSRVLHIAGGEKFIQPLIGLINKTEFASEHYFFIAEKNIRYKIERADNVTLLSDFPNKAIGLLSLIKQMDRADAIVIHGLFGKIMYILFLLPWTLKKVHWVIWGGDLYIHQSVDKTIKWRLDEFVRHRIIPKIGFLTYWIDGDFDLAEEWYRAKGKRQECLMYLSNLCDDVGGAPELCDDARCVLVGNSADPGNCHQEIFDRLRELDDHKFTIICPLSYGDPVYAEKIVRIGAEYFGERFIPLRDFLDIQEYKNILWKIDIAIFAHKRQQALGNTISLLAMGKKVFMRDGVTSWGALTNRGLVVYPLASLSLEPIPKDVAENNMKTARSKFSKQMLISQLKNIFDEQLIKNDRRDRL